MFWLTKRFEGPSLVNVYLVFMQQALVRLEFLSTFCTETFAFKFILSYAANDAWILNRELIQI